MKFSGGFFQQSGEGTAGGRHTLNLSGVWGLRASLFFLQTDGAVPGACLWTVLSDCCANEGDNRVTVREHLRERGGITAGNRYTESDLLLPQPSNYISWRFANSKYVISLHLHIFQRVGSRSVRLLRRKKIWDAYFTLSSPHFRESESHPLERRPWCHVALNKCTNTWGLWHILYTQSSKKKKKKKSTYRSATRTHGSTGCVCSFPARYLLCYILWELSLISVPLC